MNRPLKRKLANAILAFLALHKAGTAFESITIVTGAGTTLEQEALFDDGGASPAQLQATEPALPYLAVEVATVADPDLPGVCSFEAVLHLKTASEDSEDGEPSTRFEADEILRDLHNIMMRPPNDDAAFSDENKECDAFRIFTNKPDGTDERETFRTPLHTYALWHTTAPSLFDEGSNWHDQLVYAGVAQDMDDS